MTTSSVPGAVSPTALMNSYSNSSTPSRGGATRSATTSAKVRLRVALVGTYTELTTERFALAPAVVKSTSAAGFSVTSIVRFSASAASAGRSVSVLTLTTLTVPVLFGFSLPVTAANPVLPTTASNASSPSMVMVSTLVRRSTIALSRRSMESLASTVTLTTAPAPLSTEARRSEKSVPLYPVTLRTAPSPMMMRSMP